MAFNKTKFRVAIFSKCVNNVNYSVNCVTLSKLSGSNFVKIILLETNENERN